GVVGLRRERVPVRRKELAHLGLELERRVVETQIHQILSLKIGLTTLPPGLRGSASRNSTDRGTLKLAKCCRVCAITVSASSSTPGLATSKALPTSPSRSSGTPLTADSATPSSRASTCSTSAG